MVMVVVVMVVMVMVMMMVLMRVLAAVEKKEGVGDTGMPGLRARELRGHS